MGRRAIAPTPGAVRRVWADLDGDLVPDLITPVPPAAPYACSSSRAAAAPAVDYASSGTSVAHDRGRRADGGRCRARDFVALRRRRAPRRRKALAAPTHVPALRLLQLRDRRRRPGRRRARGIVVTLGPILRRQLRLVQPSRHVALAAPGWSVPVLQRRPRSAAGRARRSGSRRRRDFATGNQASSPWAGTTAPRASTRPTTGHELRGRRSVGARRRSRCRADVLAAFPAAWKSAAAGRHCVRAAGGFRDRHRESCAALRRRAATDTRPGRLALESAAGGVPAGVGGTFGASSTFAAGSSGTLATFDHGGDGRLDVVIAGLRDAPADHLRVRIALQADGRGLHAQRHLQRRSSVARAVGSGARVAAPVSQRDLLLRHERALGAVPQHDVCGPAAHPHACAELGRPAAAEADCTGSLAFDFNAYVATAALRQRSRSQHDRAASSGCETSERRR